MLKTALDIGIRENDYWEMSIAEVIRAIESFNRQKELEMKTIASQNYVLAGLIGAFVAHVLSNEAEVPTLEQAYPALFGNDQKQEDIKPKEDINVARFIQFAIRHNLKYKQEGVKNDDRRTESNNNSTNKTI